MALPPLPTKPNQQLINHTLDHELHEEHDRRLSQARDLGRRIRARLAGWRLPLLAVRTTYSLLRGTASPEQWAQALVGLRGDDADSSLQAAKDRRGANHPSDQAAGGAVLAAVRALERARTSGAAVAGPARVQDAPTLAVRSDHDRDADSDGDADADAEPWAILADRDDVLGLPACIDHWGRGKVGIGATVELARGEGEDEDEDTLLLAPTETAYARLCLLLSWRHEEPEAWARWRRGGAARDGLDCTGLVALVRDEAWGRRLRDLGAEIWWRADVRPQQTPVAFPVASAPILTHHDDRGRAAAGILAAIRQRRTVRREDARHAGNALTDLCAMPAAYAGYEEQLDAGAALAARCRWLPGGQDEQGRPQLHLPPRGAGLFGRDIDPDALLRERAETGLVDRYQAQCDVARAAARARLEKELRIIADKRFAGYILMVWELADGHHTCGRGSGASSIVCYCLGITNVDPVKYHLVFERFLSPERIDPPDIDVDFAWDERDEVIGRTIARYGREHVAMVATHQGMHRWAALREAARAHGIPDGAIATMSQRLRESDLYGQGVEPPEPWPAIIAAADAIAGAPRHLGLHCGGVVITARPVRELVPVHPAAKSLEVPGHGRLRVPTIAWEKDGAEDLGFIKVDVLGNRSLAVLRDCLEDLEVDGNPLELLSWNPMEDERTKDIVARGATMGVFYVESPSMRQLQAKVGSPDFDRLVVHSSIIRPAGTNFIDTYIRRYHRSKETGGDVPEAELREWYPHPALRGLLSDSFGVLSYQEDVMLVSQALAGFGSKEANELRKALGRSDTGTRLQALANRFREGCLANGVAEDVLDWVWRMISSFAGYSFCKAHSASYAVVSFQCAYLKAHHPAHFMARVIANQGGYYHTAAYVEEARRLGVEIRGPCVLRSAWKTQREGAGAIRIGFQLVTGLSMATAEAIIRERSVVRRPSSVLGHQDGCPFRSLRELKSRCRIQADEMKALDDGGAFDALLPHLNTAQRTWLVTVVSREAEAFIHPPSVAGQAILDLLAEDLSDPVPPPLRDLPLEVVRQRRYACLGLLPERHPLCLWHLPKRAVFCRDITARADRRRLSVIAWPIARKRVSATYSKDEDGVELDTPRFEAMCFVTVEDETGLTETVWFPDAYRAYGALLERGEPLRLTGTVAVAFGYPTLTIEHADCRWGATAPQHRPAPTDRGLTPACPP